MAVKSIESEEQLQQILLQTDLVVVDFYAKWCGPCKMMAPILDQLSDIVGDKITIVKVDVEQHPVLAKQYDIRNIPALIKFNKGQFSSIKIGALSKPDLIRFLGDEH